MSDEMIDIVNTFGFDPVSVGMRHRHWWVADEDDYEYVAGWLYVETRDPGGGVFDTVSMKKDNFEGLHINPYDSAYATYIFSPLGGDDG